MDKILQTLLEKVADLHGVPEGAYNIRPTARWLEEIRRPTSISSQERTERASTYTLSRERKRRVCIFR